MRERERQHDEQPQTGGGTPGNDHLGSIGDTAARLLAVADSAIGQALSRDSSVFLRAVQQHGGQ